MPGEESLLRTGLLGFFCSVKCPGSLILQTYDLCQKFKDVGVAVVSGFHSPIEKECLRIVLRGTALIAWCPARELERMRIPQQLREPVAKGQLLILTAFPSSIRRPTKATSQKRNEFVAELSRAVFVSYADPSGKTAQLCERLLKAGKPMFTFDDPHNQPLLDIGAKTDKDLDRLVSMIVTELGIGHSITESRYP